MTRAEMLQRMSSSEFFEWMVLEQVEPFGEQADYLRAGIIAATLANVHRGKDHPPYKPQDFMLKLKDSEEVAPKRQTSEDIGTIMRFAALAQEAKLRG